MKKISVKKLKEIKGGGIFNFSLFKKSKFGGGKSRGSGFSGSW